MFHHSTAAFVQSALQVLLYQVPHPPTTSEVMGVTRPSLIGFDPHICSASPVLTNPPAQLPTSWLSGTLCGPITVGHTNSP